MQGKGIKTKAKTSKEKVYFSELNCDKCECNMDSGICEDCIADANSEFYRDFRKIAPKADKILVIAHHSNWRGDTGFLVVPFDKLVLRNIFAKTSTYSKKVFKIGKSMYIKGYSHDTPLGGEWLLKPICSNGANDDWIIHKAKQKYA